MHTRLMLTALTAAMLAQPTCAQDFDFNEVSYTPQATTFRLFAPQGGKTSRGVRLHLYRDADAQRPFKTVKLKCAETSAEGGVWTATVKGDMKHNYYTFAVADPRSDGKRPTYMEETPGVFAKAVSVNGRRGYILDLNDTDPEGWKSDSKPSIPSAADWVIYEMHHRDFSIARRDAQHPGKFLALTEPWAIDHLKSLGINAVHILPSYDYGSVDETRLDKPQYNWGYDPVNYNVPEGSYSTDPYTPETRIREFKQMVHALHQAGIKVVLDVVFNHTYDIEHSNFQRTYPDYYYRKTADGQYSNGSGCGNETASERTLMRQFIVESVKYWAREYHIDGFRFDLMGVHDIETMRLVREALDKEAPGTLVYGEGWSAGTCALPNDMLGMKANITKMPGIAAFSDELRDALRGPFSDDTKGAFLAGIPGQEESIKFGLAGAIGHPQVDCRQVNYAQQPWTLQPTQMIAYVSCHDDMCLTDRLRASIPGIGDDELDRLDKLAQTAVFTSQGIPFMLAGEELLRDKKGVHNSFESPDSINQLPWGNDDPRHTGMLEYYRKLIHLRNNHPAFRLASAEKVRKSLSFLPTQPCLVAFTIDGKDAGDHWNHIIVALNGSRETRTIEVAEGTYTIVCQDGSIDEQGLGLLQGPVVEVAPQSALIIHD